MTQRGWGGTPKEGVQEVPHSPLSSSLSSEQDDDDPDVEGESFPRSSSESESSAESGLERSTGSSGAGISGVGDRGEVVAAPAPPAGG